MESKAVTVKPDQKAIVRVADMSVIESVLITGDLAKLTSLERVTYYNRVCESVGLNPLTRPFEYTNYEGKLILYARKDATEQLRKIHSVSVTDLKKELIGDLLHVTAFVEDGNGRRDVGTGVVSLVGLKGKDLANAYMKGETKAKRRATLSICGLGMLDETEIEDSSARDVSNTKASALRERLKESPREVVHTQSQAVVETKMPEVTESEPIQTQVASEPAEPTYLAEALTDYEQKDLAKAAGFKWNKDSKRWLKEVTASEVASLAFETRMVEEG